MPLWLSEEDVAGLVSAASATTVIEACMRRTAAGEVDLLPRHRLALDGGYFAVMAASDRGLGVAGAKSYTLVDGRLSFVVCLFDAASGALTALVAADRLGRLRTSAASAVAARHLARPGARTLGLIGTGAQGRAHLDALAAALPALEEVVAWSPDHERLTAFCESTGATPGETAADAGGCDVVVTATTSRDPVLRGDWLRAGALVCAVGANFPDARELDSEVIARAAFVCTDSLEEAKLEAGDLIEPVAAGRLDWLEVHPLHEVVAGELVGRQADEDVVLFKSNGIASWDVALGHEAVRLAKERDVGLELRAEE